MAKTGRGLRQRGERRQNRLRARGSPPIRAGSLHPARRRLGVAVSYAASARSSTLPAALIESASALSDSGAGPRRTTEFESGPSVGLGKEHVVGDDLGWRAGQVINQHRVDGARPRPSTCVRLEVAQRGLVDLDQRDVRPRRFRPRRVRQAPVVGPELDRLERMQSTGEAREQQIDRQDDDCRDAANEQAGICFAQGWVLGKARRLPAPRPPGKTDGGQPQDASLQPTAGPRVSSGRCRVTADRCPAFHATRSAPAADGRVVPAPESSG